MNNRAFDWARNSLFRYLVYLLRRNMPISSPYHTPSLSRKHYGNMPLTNSKPSKRNTRLRRGVPNDVLIGATPDPSEYIFLCDYTIAGKRGVDGLTFEASMINQLQVKAINQTGYTVGKFPSGANWQWYDNAEVVESATAVCGQALKLNPIAESGAITEADYPDFLHYVVTEDLRDTSKPKVVNVEILDSSLTIIKGMEKNVINPIGITKMINRGLGRGTPVRRFGKNRRIRISSYVSGVTASPTCLSSVKIHRLTHENVPLISCYTREDAGTSHFSSPENIQALNDAITYTSARPVVVIALGYNDIYSADPATVTTPEVYEANLEMMIMGINADIVLATPFHSMAMPHAVLGTNHDDYRGAIYRLADKYKLQVIDLSAMDFNDYFADDFHLTKQGNELLADVFFEELEFYKLVTPSFLNFPITLAPDLTVHTYSHYPAAKLNRDGILTLNGVVIKNISIPNNRMCSIVITNLTSHALMPAVKDNPDHFATTKRVICHVDLNIPAYSSALTIPASFNPTMTGAMSVSFSLPVDIPIPASPVDATVYLDGISYSILD